MTDRYDPPSARNTAAGAPAQWRDAAIPLTMLGIFALVAVISVIAAAASRAAAPRGWPVPALGGPMLRALFDTGASDLDPLIGPDGSRWAFWGVAVVLAALVSTVVGVPVWWIAARVGWSGDPARALANRRDYRDMRGKGAARRARQLRPSLGQGRVKTSDLGMRLGRNDSSGDELFASEEDVILTVAGPRSNKTSAMVVPAVLTAPGPVITTSNKIDVYALTAAMRSGAGTLTVFDPQMMLGKRTQDWWWNPLDEVRDIIDAARLMEPFVATIGAGSERADPYFTPAAGRLIAQLTLAAASPTLVPGEAPYSLRTVSRWLAERSREPAEVLRRAQQDEAAAGLTGLLETPDEQKGGVFETALTALSCLESEAVARYVTPPGSWVARPGLPVPGLNTIHRFDPWAFVAGKDDKDGKRGYGTVYALTKEGAGAAAPVVAALVDALLRTAEEAATAQGGRCDPPVRAVLDEAANICPIKDLPALYSHYGSRSIQLMTFLQSPDQAVKVWGRSGWGALWGSATVKLIGASVHDTEFCEQVSKLVGTHEVPTWSDQRGRGGGSTTRSSREKRILEVADIAAMPKSHAVLITAGRRAGLIRLLPWYTEPESDDITTNYDAAIAAVRDAAVVNLGPDNPLSRRIAGQRPPGAA
jgi:type IV secretory pathway TraG/TraD family ATPase VirD4